MHKRVSIRILPTIVLVWCSAFCSAQSLVIYPAIDALPRSMAFIVKVRNPGGVWKAVPVYQVKVADGRGARTITQESAMAYFDFSGRVEIAITAPAPLNADPTPAPFSAQQIVTIFRLTPHLTHRAFPPYDSVAARGCPMFPAIKGPHHEDIRCIDRCPGHFGHWCICSHWQF